MRIIHPKNGKRVNKVEWREKGSGVALENEKVAFDVP